MDIYKEQSYSKDISLKFDEINVFFGEKDYTSNFNRIEIFQKIEEELKNIDVIYKTKNYKLIHDMIMQIIHFLNSENYEFEDNDENFILFFIQKSQLLTNLSEFFETNNENFILSIFHFFISLSVLSGDYIDFLIPHFKNIEFIIVFLKKNINSTKILSNFYILLRVFCEYSEIYRLNLINSNFFSFNNFVFQNFNKLQSLIFFSKFFQDISDDLDLNAAFQEFQQFFSLLKVYFNGIIIKNFNSTLPNPKSFKYESKISFLIINLFRNCYLSSQIKSIFISENISLFIQDQLCYFDSNNIFFQKIISDCIDVIEISYPIQNIQKFVQFYNKLFEFINVLPFSKKSLLFKSFVSIIYKSSDPIIYKIIPEITSELRDYSNSEIYFGEDIDNFIAKICQNE